MSESSPVANIERSHIKDKLKKFLRPVLLATAVGASSLVGLGCDKGSSKQVEKPDNQTTNEVEKSEEHTESKLEGLHALDTRIQNVIRTQKISEVDIGKLAALDLKLQESMDSEESAAKIDIKGINNMLDTFERHISLENILKDKEKDLQDSAPVVPHEKKQTEESPIMNDIRHRAQEEFRERDAEQHKLEQKVLEVALKKGLVNLEEYKHRQHHTLNALKLANIPVEATLDGIEVPFSREDFTPQELHQLQFVVQFNQDNPHNLAILERLGVVEDQKNEAAQPQRQAPQRSPTQRIPGQGNDYPLNDF